DATLLGELVEFAVAVEIMRGLQVIAIFGDGHKHGLINGSTASVCEFLEVDDRKRLQEVEPRLASHAVGFFPEHADFRSSTAERAGQVYVCGDMASRGSHLRHHVWLENGQSVVLCLRVETGDNIVENNGVWIPRLDDLAELALGARHLFAESPAFRLQ